MKTCDGTVPASTTPLCIGGLVSGVTLALLLSANAVFVLLYGFLGLQGSSIFTGSFLFSSEIAILLLSFRPCLLLTADYAFGAFLFCIALSFVKNGNTAATKEWQLLTASLFAYPACRLLYVGKAVTKGITWVSMLVVFAGTIVTMPALVSQWNDLHGKPYVLGHDATATHFLGALGFLLLALTTIQLSMRRTAFLSALLFLPISIFAASMVRFTFAAIIGSLCLVGILSSPSQRRYIAIITCTVLAGIIVGNVARSETSKVLLAYAVEATQTSAPQTNAPEIPPSISGGSPCGFTNEFNSVAIRTTLLRDSLRLMTNSGPFGFGLDSFMSLSCIKGMQVHNSILQAVVEFGWLGSVSLLSLIGLCSVPLIRLARNDESARFVLCSLAYITAMSLAHGRSSRDLVLFAMLGMAVGINEQQAKMSRRSVKLA